MAKKKRGYEAGDEDDAPADVGAVWGESPEKPAQTPTVQIRIETDQGEFVFGEHDPMAIPCSPPDFVEACRVQVGQRLLISGKTHVVRAVGFA